jgi:hypothetical protein
MEDWMPLKIVDLMFKVFRRVSGKEARTLYSQLLEAKTELLNWQEDSAWKVSSKHLVKYTSFEPHQLNALAIFQDQWSSKFPNLPELIGPGPHELFDDARINHLFTMVGDCKDWNVLELGPLEGGHSHMLNSRVRSVMSIEANQNAFLKCLIVKNLFKLENVDFYWGDFTKLRTTETFDLVLAVGILYHMERPVELLEQISKLSSRVFFWTHYFEPDIKKWDSNLQSQIGTKWDIDATEMHSGENLKDLRVVPYLYKESLGWAGFCGGPATQSRWIYKEDLINAFKSLGYSKVEISFDMPNHANGPAFCIYAEKE